MILLRGDGDRESAPGLGGGAIFTGGWGRGAGGGRRGLFGRPGRPGSGLLGGSNGVETRFKDLRVSFLRKSVNNARLPVA